MFWMVLVGCDGGGIAGPGGDGPGGTGPLDLPGRIETVVRVVGPCSDKHVATEEVELGTGRVSNPGDPRIATTVQASIPDDVDADGVLVELVFEGANDTGSPVLSAHEADLGGGERATIELHAGLLCAGGVLPKPGHYDRTTPLVSTDLLGGDEVTQQVPIRVTIE